MGIPSPSAHRTITCLADNTKDTDDTEVGLNCWIRYVLDMYQIVGHEMLYAF